MMSRRWYVVVLLAVLYVLSYIDRVIVTLMVEPMKGEFNLSDTRMGLLMGPAFAVLFAFASLPLAWLVDHGNRKRYLLFGVILWSLCTALAGFANSFGMLLALRMGLAIGEAVLSPVAVSLIGDLFRKGERSTPMAVYVASSMVGIILAYVVGGVIIQLAESGVLTSALGIPPMAPWRLSLVAVGVPGLLLALLIFFTVREPARGHADTAADGTTPQEAERYGVFASLREASSFYGPVALGAALLCAILNGAVAWYPTHLIRTQGVSAPEAGYIFSTAVLAGIIPLLAIPILAKRVARAGRKDLLLFFPLLQIPLGLVCFILALLQSSIVAASVLMVIGYGLLSSVTGLPQVVVPHTAPPAYRGRLIAMMTFTNNIIGLGLGVYLIGFLSDNAFSGPDALGNSLLAMAGAAGPLAWLLFLLAWKPYRDASNRTPNAGRL